MKKTVKKKSYKAPDTLKEMLALIELGLDSGYGASLWEVLTALRGPDSGDSTAKLATTAVIRKAAFPSEPNVGAVYGEDTEHYLAYRTRLWADDDCNWHFTSHAQRAFRALGLEWARSDSYYEPK